MLRSALLGVQCCRQAVTQTVVKRNLGVSAVLAQKATATDPIQQLFVDKIREYAKKSQAAGGGFVEASPATEKSLQDELAKVDRMFGATGPDFLKFPSFNFTDPVLEDVGVSFEIKDVASEEAEALQATLEDDDDTTFFEA